MNSLFKSLSSREYMKIAVLSRKEVFQESRSDDEDDHEDEQFYARIGQLQMNITLAYPSMRI